MQTVDDAMRILHQLAEMKTLLLLVGSIITLCYTLFVAYYFRDEEIRIFLISLLGLACLLFSRQFADDYNADFFLNISTDLIGATITVILLGAWVIDVGWWFVIMLIIIVFNILLIEVSGSWEPFFLNMSSELLGAFIIFIIARREWLWPKYRYHAKRQQRYEQEIASLMEQRNAAALTNLENTQLQLAALQTEIEGPEVELIIWDLEIHVRARDIETLNRRIEEISSVLNISHQGALQPDPKAGMVGCTLFGTADADTNLSTDLTA
jgi:hypothetical protein